MPLTRILAELAINTTSADFSDTTYAAARLMTLDSLACVLGAVKSPGVPESIDMVRTWGGTPQARILTDSGPALPLPSAVFAGGVLTHALDYDDVHVPTSMHVMSVMFPTCLSTAEWTGADGRAFLDALTVGTEVSVRLAALTRKVQDLAFLPTSVNGVFGAAAAVCRLTGQSVDQTVDALGLAYAQAAGNRQALMDMTLGKRLQPAFAARDGVIAASLSARGVTGARRAIEGNAGLVKGYHKHDLPEDAEDILRGKQNTAPWEIEAESVKRYCSCGSAHPMTDAAMELATECDLHAERIDHVEICWHGGFNPLVGMPFKLEGNPQVNAQFSSPYCVALALLRRTGAVDRLTDEAIRADREVADFAINKVTMVEHVEPGPTMVERPEGWHPYTSKPQTVIVHLKDGRTLRRDVAPAQTFAPGRVTWDDVVEKFHQCAGFSGKLSTDAAGRVVELVSTLHEQDRVDGLIDLVNGG